MSAKESSITLSVQGEGAVLIGDGEARFAVDAQVFGGPLTFSLRSIDSISIKGIWDAISKELDKEFDVTLPEIPEGPWSELFSTGIYPSIWLEPSGDKGPNIYLQLTFETPVQIGLKPYHIGPVEITIEPSFAVNSLMVGYDKAKGLNVSASVTMPTTTAKAKTRTALAKPGDAGSVTKIVSYPFPLPAQKEKPTFQVHYLGLGQRVGPKVVLDTSIEDPLAYIFEEIEKTFTINDPKEVLTKLAKDFYDPKLGWFIAADIEIKSFRIRAIFNDPSIYGLEITVEKDPPSLFGGLKFEILYQRISPNLGVYFVALTLPTAMRRIPLEAFILILPGFSLWVYTNGDFRINVGWPVGENSIGISWDILTGWVGFYFAKLRSGDNPGANPNVDFNPILALGIGFRLEAGISIDAGVFSASLSISVTVTMQGLLAWKAGKENGIATKPDAYWFAGTFEIQVLIKGSVDFVVIKASVSIGFSVKVAIALENGYGTELLIHAQVTASASVKILFVTVHFSFHTSISHRVQLVAGTPVASVSGPQQAGLKGLLGPSHEERMSLNLRAASALRSDLAPILRTPGEALVPPHRLAPDLRARGAGRMAPSQRGVPTARMAAADPPGPPKVTLNVRFVLQGTVLYSDDGDATKDQFGAVGLLLLGGRAPGSMATETTRTDFEDLVARIVCWLLNDSGEAPHLDAPLSSQLAKLKQTLKDIDALTFGDELKTFFGQHITFRIEGVDGTAPADPDIEAAQSYTALPMFDEVQMVLDSKTRDFHSLNPIPGTYADAVDWYFEGLSLFGEPSSASVEGRDGLTPPPTRSAAGFVFADFYLMLATHVVTQLHADAVAYEKGAHKDLHAAGGAAAGGAAETGPGDLNPALGRFLLATDHQTELDKLLDAFDYASASGFVSRALLGGQQLPEPDAVEGVTRETIHDVPVASVYTLTGQQVPVAATGAAQVVAADLSVSATLGGPLPDWLVLAPPASGGTAATAKLSLPAAIPALPVPSWSGAGLGTLPPGLAPAGDAGQICYTAADPVTKVGLKLTTRNQTVWSDPAPVKRAIIALPVPLLALTATMTGITAVPSDAKDDETPDQNAPQIEAGAGLIFDLPITQINSAAVSATETTTDAGVVKNLYQIWATDDVSRERIRQIVEGGSEGISITLLYLDADGETMASGTLDTQSMILRANQSTENQAKEVSTRMRSAVVSDDADQDPPFALLTSDPIGALRLIWEESVVNAPGFYLFYRTEDGAGLPSRLFEQSGQTKKPSSGAPENGETGGQSATIPGTNGAAATLRVLVRFGAEAPGRVPLTAMANCVISEQLVARTTSLEIFDAESSPVPSWHSGFGAGELGFRLDWSHQNTADPAPGQINPAALYHLLQFNVQGQSGKAGEVWSLPLNPLQSASQDPACLAGASDRDPVPALTAEPAGPQIYQQVFSAYRFLSQTRAATDATSVYDLVGVDIALRYRLTDMFGNSLPAQSLANQTGTYHDPIVNVGQWPMVQTSHYFTAPPDNAGAISGGTLVVCLQFDTAGLDALAQHAARTADLRASLAAPGSAGGEPNAQLAALAQKFALIRQQIRDPGTSHRLTASLLGDGAEGLDIRDDLAEFVDQIVQRIEDQKNNAVVLGAGNQPQPLTQALTVPIPFSAIASLTGDILPVEVRMTATRADGLAPGIKDKLPEAATSTARIPPRRGEDFPPLKGAQIADLCPPTPARDAGTKASLNLYALHFESAFGGFDGQGGALKLAERAGLVADSDADEVQTLWAVRFAGAPTAGPGLHAAFDPDLIAYFALPPLNTEPITRTVSGKTHNAVDMDAWSRQCFAAIDQLFEPRLAAAISLLETGGPPGKSSFAKLTTAKKTIAGAMPKTLAAVLQDSAAGKQTAAAEALEQAMLVRLSEAYTVSTVLQARADVTTGTASSGPGTRAPELFGRIGPPLKPADAAQNPKGSQQSKVYDLSAGRLDAAPGEQWSTVLVTVTDREEHSSLSLDLGFDITAIQHDFETAETFEGYTPSAWLKFVRPGDAILTLPITGAAPAQIPIPLPFEPPAPALTLQKAEGAALDWTPGDGLTALIQGALKWHYETGLHAKLVAQDQLYFDAIFGIGEVHRAARSAVSKPINETLFDAMAGFLEGWAVFEPAIPSILAAGLSAPDDPSRAAAQQQVAALTALVTAIADAWTPRVAPMGRLGLEEPEIIHYRLQIERDGSSADITFTLDGWMADNKGGARAPTRWPTIAFTPQTGSNAIPSWTPEGDPVEHKDGAQTWWRLTHNAPANTFPQDFDFTWSDLDLSKRQLGRLEAWNVRNARLVDDAETNPDFVYETSVVSFASPAIPLIERNKLPTVKPDEGSTLCSVLETLLTPLAFGASTLKPFVRVQVNLRYTLATGADPALQSLDATIPLLLQPNLLLDKTGKAGSTPAAAAEGLRAAIAAGFDRFRGGRNHVYLDLGLTLFGAQAGQQMPLVTIDPLSLDVAEVPASWWTATA